MIFSEKIHKLRKENNMTQEDLAEKLNVSRQTISKWENGVTFPDIDNILQLCKVFNISSDSLLNYHGEIKTKNVLKLNWFYLVSFISSLIIVITLLILKKFDETSSVITINAYGVIFILLLGICVFSVKFIFKNRK